MGIVVINHETKNMESKAAFFLNRLRPLDLWRESSSKHFFAAKMLERLM